MHGPFCRIFEWVGVGVRCAQLKTTMTEPIASSSSSPINFKTQKTPRKHKAKAKAKAKAVSHNPAIVDPTPTAAPTAASQGSSRPTASFPPSPSSSHDQDDIADSGDYGDFDYDAVKADNSVELWLIRAPSTVRPTIHPSSFSLFLSPSSSHFGSFPNF